MHSVVLCPLLLDQFRLSVRPSVRDKSEYCENGESLGYYTMGSPQKVTTGLLRGPIANPLRPALLQNGGLTTSSQNLHRQTALDVTV